MLPMNKEAETDLTKAELDELLTAMELPDGGASAARDAVHYTLEAEGKEASVDLRKVPVKYKAMIEELVAKLEIVK